MIFDTRVAMEPCNVSSVGPNTGESFIGRRQGTRESEVLGGEMEQLMVTIVLHIVEDH